MAKSRRTKTIQSRAETQRWSLDFGAPLSRRYVVTLARTSRNARIEEGGLLPSGATSKIVVALPSWIEEKAKTLARALLKVCEQFESLPDVLDVVGRLGEKRRTELAYIDNLYARRQGSEGRLYGLPESGNGGISSN